MVIRWLCLCLIVLCGIGAAFAQDVQTFISEDGTLSFEYPSGWWVEASPTSNPPNQVMINKLPKESFTSPDNVVIMIVPPVKSFEFIGIDAETPHEMVEQSVAMTNNAKPLLEEMFGNGPVITVDGTPQPTMTIPPRPEVTPIVPQVIDFTVNGRSAAYSYIIMQAAGMDASMMTVVVDVGDDYWAVLNATSVMGGLGAIQQNEQAIVSIAQSLRFTPLPPKVSNNPDLPRVYSGPVGIWQRGSLEFNYPDDWYVSSSIILSFSNKEGSIMNTQPVSGRFIAQINGASETLAAVDPTEVANECHVVKKPWTAQSVVDEIFAQTFPSHLKELTQAGIAMTQPEAITVNGVNMVYFRLFQGDMESLSILIDLGENNILSLSVTSVRGEMAGFEDQIFQVASTFRYTPIIPNTCPNSQL